MTTSGVSIYQATRDSIINAALRKCQVLEEGQVANPAQLATGLEALNNVVLEFITLGMPLWKRKEYNITLVSGQRDYTMGVGQAISTPYPLKLQEATLTQPYSNSQINVNILASYDFNLLPVNSSGTVVNLKYQPYVNYGVVSVWPTPDASTPIGTILTLTYQSPTEVFVSAADTPDFPQQWNNALIYGTAALLSDEYVLPITDKQWIASQADKHVSVALSFGTEEASMYIRPDRRG